MDRKVEEIKYKVLDLINKKKDVKIPKMGFTDYYVQHNSVQPQQKHSSVPGSNSSGRNSAASSSKYDFCSFYDDDDDGDGDRGKGTADGQSRDSNRLSDQEILESTEAIYFDAGSKTGLHELNKLSETDGLLNCQCIEKAMGTLKQQHKVISKKALQLILEQRPACNEEFRRIQETEGLLRETIAKCRSTRDHLDGSKKLLTTTNLEILAAYKKRQTLLNLLKTLNALKSMRSIDQRLQKRLSESDYSGAIAILLENKNLSERFQQYNCIESLSTKLQDTLMMSEIQLEAVLNEVPAGFDAKKYGKLQEAYKLLEKQLIAMDQLHMNFISSIHTAAFTVLKQHMEASLEDNKQKLTFEQMCENVPSEKYIHCLTDLCRGFWKILVSYYQVRCWHQNQKLYEKGRDAQRTESAQQQSNESFHEEYIQQKLEMGQFRLWNDIQSKICIFINSTKLSSLKYEYFIQILAIIQRLKKVGIEFCEDPSEKLMEHMQRQSVEFFRRYHIACLEEIGLFFDHEVWVPIGSFTDVSQLQEYKNFKHALVKNQNGTVRNGGRSSSQENKSLDPLGIGSSNRPVNSTSSVHSQDESSLYGSCGYFLRFTEKSSPFDGGFDCTMLEEDILAGIADESSYYYSEDSSENNENYYDQSPEAKQKLPPVTTTAATPQNASSSSTLLTVTNTSLTVLRCIGRYLYFCKLLHSIAPHIVMSMTELLDFYFYSVHEIFSRDLPVPRDNLYSPALKRILSQIQTAILPKLRKWPLSDEMIKEDLANPDLMYGLQKRIVAAESCLSLIGQFRLMEEYLGGLLLQSDPSGQEQLRRYLAEAIESIPDVRKPIYMCVTARVVDIQNVLHAMGKVKWDINHVNVQHSSYVDIMNRGVQHFAMRLEEVSGQQANIPKDALWDCFVHVLTHLLVEGFSNAKKCSPGGRALMQLDFIHFISILEIISAGKYPDHRAYVEQYIKAYYLPKDLLEEWLLEGFGRGYSVKHLTGLVQCACSSDKKIRQKLLALVESAGSGSISNSNSGDNASSSSQREQDLNKES